MNNLRTYIALIVFTLTSITSIGQDEQTIMTLFGRISQTDSLKSCLMQTKDDSTVVFNYKTPDVDKFGIVEFELKDFNLNFDTGSNFLFSGTPFGNVEEFDVSSKKAFIVIYIEGMGDRKKKGNFEKVSYSFINKKNRWMLKGIKYD